jgi:hypothetical protein
VVICSGRVRSHHRDYPSNTTRRRTTDPAAKGRKLLEAILPALAGYLIRDAGCYGLPRTLRSRTSGKAPQVKRLIARSFSLLPPPFMRMSSQVVPTTSLTEST